MSLAVTITRGVGPSLQERLRDRVAPFYFRGVGELIDGIVADARAQWPVSDEQKPLHSRDGLLVTDEAFSPLDVVYTVTNTARTTDGAEYWQAIASNPRGRFIVAPLAALSENLEPLVRRSAEFFNNG